MLRAVNVFVFISALTVNIAWSSNSSTSSKRPPTNASPSAVAAAVARTVELQARINNLRDQFQRQPGAAEARRELQSLFTHVQALEPEVVPSDLPRGRQLNERIRVADEFNFLRRSLLGVISLAPTRDGAATELCADFHQEFHSGYYEPLDEPVKQARDLVRLALGCESGSGK